MNFFQNLIKPKQHVSIGVEYRLKNNGNPFEKEVVVKVKDVKDGWVLYAMKPYCGVFQNCSMEEDSFLDVYERTETKNYIEDLTYIDGNLR